MTQKEKELLLKDLCARLPYGVVYTDSQHGDSRITEIDTISEVVYFYDVDEYIEIKNCKPYLRTISSMTEEEKQVLELCNAFVEPRSIELKVDFYNQCHLDYRGLIDKGLAIEAPKGMYNIKE